MESEAEFKPGMFHLFDLHNDEAAGVLLAQAEQFLGEFGGYPSASFKNTAGVAHCLLGKKEKALELFRQVLLDDPENINALENSRIVHSQLGQKEDAEACELKVQSSLDDSQPERDLAFIKARCFAEQGLAIKCNVAVELLETLGGEDLDRAKKVLAYGVKAFQVDDGRLFPPEERLQWEFFMGSSYLDVYNHYSRMGSGTEDQLDIYNKAVHVLARVARESNQDNHQYKAKAWTLLGTLLWKKTFWDDSNDKPSSVTDCNLIEEYNNPNLCFITALELSPKDPQIMCRYSRFLVRKKEYEKAKHILNKSIEIDKSSKNWLAFSSRAKVYKGIYLERLQIFRTACGSRKQETPGFHRFSVQTDELSDDLLAFSPRHRAKVHKETYVAQGKAFKLTRTRSRKRANPPDRRLLMLAKLDSEYSIQIHPNLQERINLADILTLLERKQEAIEQFQHVVHHLGGWKNPEVHTKMGFCLRSMAQTGKWKLRRMAIESFKRAIEIERRNQKRLVSSLNALRLLMDECIKYPGCGYLLDEFCYWLVEVDKKYEDEPTSKLIQSLCGQCEKQMILVCRRLVEQKRRSLATKCLSELVGINRTVAKQIKTLKTELSNDMTLLSLSEAEHCTDSVNIRPALTSSKNKKKTFDCLVLHCTVRADADWVHYSLLPRLEKGHGYKCCIPARDIHPNSSRDFESCVRDAGCVIVVLTSSFCSNAVCKDQLAHIVPADIVEDDSRKIIAVVREECDLPDTLRGMKTIQYYSWEMLLRDVNKSCSLR